MGSFGDESNQLNRLWYNLPQTKLSYTEIFIATLGCDFDFNPYPFDNHECKIFFNNWMGGSKRVQLLSPKIYIVDSEHDEIEGQNLTVTKERLDYDCIFEALPSRNFTDLVGIFSRSIIQVHLKRTLKSRHKIFGTYHFSTGIFAAISIISFSIDIDSVPGRMGLLITLYLILINTYGSLKAPPKRSFSSIEIWFVGTQVPLLLAIVEYGGLLFLKKFFSNKNFKNFKLFNKDYSIFIFIDIISLCISVVFQLIFNLLYWIVL